LKSSMWSLRNLHKLFGRNRLAWFRKRILKTSMKKYKKSRRGKKGKIFWPQWQPTWKKKEVKSRSLRRTPKMESQNSRTWRRKNLNRSSKWGDGIQQWVIRPRSRRNRVRPDSNHNSQEWLATTDKPISTLLYQ
jgi:hypothetical protein